MKKVLLMASFALTSLFASANSGEQIPQNIHITNAPNYYSQNPNSAEASKPSLHQWGIYPYMWANSHGGGLGGSLRLRKNHSGIELAAQVNSIDVYYGNMYVNDARFDSLSVAYNFYFLKKAVSPYISFGVSVDGYNLSEIKDIIESRDASGFRLELEPVVRVGALYGHCFVDIGLDDMVSSRMQSIVTRVGLGFTF